MLLMFYYTYDRLNMFRALLCPSSGAHDYSADYYMGRPVSWVAVGWKVGAGRLDKCPGFSLQPGHLSNLPATNFQPTAHQETGRAMW